MRFRGSLAAPESLKAFHQDLNDAWFRPDAANEQFDLYRDLPAIQLGWPIYTWTRLNYLPVTFESDEERA
jgi:hypothetical protein